MAEKKKCLLWDYYNESYSLTMNWAKAACFKPVSFSEFSLILVLWQDAKRNILIIFPRNLYLWKNRSPPGEEQLQANTV